MKTKEINNSESDLTSYGKKIAYELAEKSILKKDMNNFLYIESILKSIENLKSPAKEKLFVELCLLGNVNVLKKAA